MYGPRRRGQVYLFLIATMLTFTAVLALPLLIDRDVVRLDFGGGEGFRTQGGGMEEHLPRVGLETGDGDIRPPQAIVTSPTTAGDVAFTVHWDSAGPDPALVYAFHVQYANAEAALADETSWDDWFLLRRSDLPREAAFTGAPGETYAFRVRTCTLALLCSAWSEHAATRVVAEAMPQEVALELTPRSPLADEAVSGNTALRWAYDHRGPGTAMVDVALLLSDDPAVPLYSGQGLYATWDTTRHDDGAYVLRLRLSDGIHNVEEEVPVRIENGGTASSDPSPSASAPETTQPSTSPQARESPAPGVPIALVGCVGFLLRRRRSC